MRKAIKNYFHLGKQDMTLICGLTCKSTERSEPSSRSTLQGIVCLLGFGLWAAVAAAAAAPRDFSAALPFLLRRLKKRSIAMDS